MKCKFFFRGKLVGTQDKKLTKRPGALIDIEGVEFRILEVLEVNGFHGPFQIARLALAKPNEDELAMVSVVLEAVHNHMRKWANEHAADTSGPGCNLPQVRGRAEGREETLAALREALQKIEADYKAGK